MEVPNETERSNAAARWFRDWLPVIMLALSGLVWGMKLETNLAAHEAEARLLERRLARVEGQLEIGILPRADERLHAVEARLTRVEMLCCDGGAGLERK